MRYPLFTDGVKYSANKLKSKVQHFLSNACSMIGENSVQQNDGGQVDLGIRMGSFDYVSLLAKTELL